jgi:NDP-sugar pyrophosphorylase family protein
MNAMVLAAGAGTRLRSVEPDVPKILVDIGGEPLLARQLRYLENQGISRVVVNAHYLADQVLDFARDHKGSLDLVVVVEQKLLGTAGGVRHALPELGDDPFVVLYGDVLTNEALAPMVERHSRQRTGATLAVYESADTEGKGTIDADGSDVVTGFTEKRTHTASGPALINAGIYVMQPGFARQIPERTALDFGHDVFPAALAQGERLAIYRLSAPVLDVGIPSALELARDEHATGKPRPA